MNDPYESSLGMLSIVCGELYHARHAHISLYRRNLPIVFFGKVSKKTELHVYSTKLEFFPKLCHITVFIMI